MATPPNRRSGYSRRAQYSTFFGYLAGVLGALIGAALLFISIGNPGIFSGPRAVAMQAAEPAGSGTARTREAGRDVIGTIRGYALAGSKFEAMRKELAEAKVRLVQAEAVKAENRRLKRLLGLATMDPKPVTVTRLISSTASSSRRYANIGAGEAQGIAKGMPVRSPLGLVGRVVETSRSSSRILLVSDSQSLVPVRRSTDNVAALAQGRGDGTLQIRLIDLGINPLKKDDVFVTSGAGGLYRSGIAIGVVTKLTPDGALAQVLSDPAATDFVLIDKASALTAPPAPSASPAEDGP